MADDSSSDENKKNVKKWGKYVLGFGFAIGLLGFIFFEPFPDAYYEFGDAGEFREACEVAEESDPEWYDSSECAQYLSRPDWPTLLVLTGCFCFPIIGVLMLVSSKSVVHQLVNLGVLERGGYWDGDREDGTNPMMRTEEPTPSAVTGNAEGAIGSQILRKLSLEPKSFKDKMTERRLQTAEILAKKGLYMEAAYEAEMAGDYEMASAYMDSGKEVVKEEIVSTSDLNEERYLAYLTTAMADGLLSSHEEKLLEEKRVEYGISKIRSQEMLDEMGYDLNNLKLVQKAREHEESGRFEEAATLLEAAGEIERAAMLRMKAKALESGNRTTSYTYNVQDSVVTGIGEGAQKSDDQDS